MPHDPTTQVTCGKGRGEEKGKVGRLVRLVKIRVVSPLRARRMRCGLGTGVGGRGKSITGRKGGGRRKDGKRLTCGEHQHGMEDMCMYIQTRSANAMMNE